MDNLRVSLVQTHLVWEDPVANRDHFSTLLSPLAGRTDLVILPEMFSTGFSMRPEALAEPPEGPTPQWMMDQAKKLDAVITGSLIIQAHGRYYNRLIWMPPDGAFRHYDKRHLFTLAGEDRHYTPGKAHLLVTWKGWRILPLICYDLRFPVWSRNVFDYDLLLYVANWPERRVQAWSTLLAARAIENQAYTIGVNRIGHDGNDVYHSGDTGLYDFQGYPVYRCAHQEDVFTAALDKTAQRDFRQKLAFLPDRDTFQIQP